LDIGVWLLVAAFFKVASGDDALAGRLQKVRARQREEFNCRLGGLFFLRRRLVYFICLSLSCWPSLGLRFLSLSEISLDFGREVEGLQGRIARIEYGLTSSQSLCKAGFVFDFPRLVIQVNSIYCSLN
jgi:hypothetical protein